MNIQDTLSNTEQKLDNSEKIKIYLCGVTVYDESHICLLYTSPSPRDRTRSRMPSSA